ncbi:hypothetical protein DF122_33645 [Burkholderia pseudomallei]|nr:hypothetical protein CF640_32285 [Burkholderia pseudomallei]RPE23667.1 hypothetical protein DF068_08130 [Burkholderia pseudomallei]RQZ55188.1 hypothetical protein DF060_07715 [Burkholderia pseudomallei]RSK56613.1 hypothetical protein DF122_33645 [Burkholderia pseudomallei]
MCGRRALRSRFAACIGRPGRARLGRGARECGGLTDAHGVFVSRRVEMPSCRRVARASRLAPRASRLAPRASRLAPRASRLAPRASRLAPRASRLAPRASDHPGARWFTRPDAIQASSASSANDASQCSPM